MPWDLRLAVPPLTLADFKACTESLSLQRCGMVTRRCTELFLIASLVALVAFTARAGEEIKNGDFAAGLTGWKCESKASKP